MSALRERDDNSAKLRAETSLYPGREEAIIEARTARYARESFIVDDELSCKDKFDEETADWERYPIDGLLLQRNEKVSADKVIDYERLLRRANEVVSIAKGLHRSQKERMCRRLSGKATIFVQSGFVWRGLKSFLRRPSF